MILDITIQADSDSATDMLALAALIASLGGRAPTSHTAMDRLIADAVGVTGEQRIDAALTPVDHSDEDAEIVTAAAALGKEKDSAGIPWDERIHSASRATVADGTWRRRKNTPDVTYNAVMAELRGASDPIPSPSTDDTPLPPVEPVVTETPAVAVDNASEVPPPPADGPDLSTFAKFVQAVNNKDEPAEKKSYAALNELSATFGVAAFKDMKDRPNDWAMFYDMVG